MARSWSACWRRSGDPGGGGGGGGGCCSCCWPAAKTTLLSNVDHFMVPTPHPARRSRPDPADSPEFRRDSPPPLVSPNKFFYSRCSSPPPPARRLRPPIFAVVCCLCFLYLLVFFFVSSFSPTRLRPFSLLSPLFYLETSPLFLCPLCSVTPSIRVRNL